MKSKEEIEELVLEKFKNKMYNPFFNVAFVEGYMQCQEDIADKKYTEDDLKKAMNYASQITNNKMKYIKDYINSLNKQD